jgi:murein DD-endopeptidase MepM/ murein hydrolase activator NlpD
MVSLLIAVLLLQAGASGAAAACWHPPVTAPVVDPFRPPACPWCAGNRGIEYGTRPGVPVRSVAAGEVTFSGRVAGTGYVVVRHLDGRRATYGGLARAFVGAGDRVQTGALIGATAGHLHFGLRAGQTYLDPAPFFGRLIGRPRLVPTDGAAPRAAPPPKLRCDVPATLGFSVPVPVAVGRSREG